MIYIQSITVEEFRGIREMTLDLKDKNFAVCGPNGTGKSGIVDALEFALTGNISRLSGRGTGDVSVIVERLHPVIGYDAESNVPIGLLHRNPMPQGAPQ